MMSRGRRERSLAFTIRPQRSRTTEPYIVVNLDEACRRQQVGEGWFARSTNVPATAISDVDPPVLSAREMLIIVPDARKAAQSRQRWRGR